MPRLTRQHAAVAVAGLLIVLALGLPWTSDTRAHIPGWYSPSICTATADGSVWCTGSYLSPGLWVGSSALSGAGSVARVFLVGALVLLIVARLRNERHWLGVAGVGLVLGILLVGLQAQGGQVAATAAALLLLYAAFSASESGAPVSRADAPPGA